MAVYLIDELRPRLRNTLYVDLFRLPAYYTNVLCQLQLDSLHIHRVVEHLHQETEYKRYSVVQQSGDITDNDPLEQHTRRGYYKRQTV